MAITSVVTIVPFDIPNKLARVTAVITDSEDSENPITVGMRKADFSTSESRAAMPGILESKYNDAVALNAEVAAVITTYEAGLQSALNTLLE